MSQEYESLTFRVGDDLPPPVWLALEELAVALADDTVDEESEVGGFQFKPGGPADPLSGLGGGGLGGKIGPGDKSFCIGLTWDDDADTTSCMVDWR